MARPRKTKKSRVSAATKKTENLIEKIKSLLTPQEADSEQSETRVIHRIRPATTLHCTWRPRRTTARRFLVTDAARICCKVIAHGATFDQIEAEVRNSCLGGDQPAPTQGGTAIQLLQEAQLSIGLMKGELDTLSDELLKITIVVGTIAGGIAIFARLPGVKLIARRILAVNTLLLSAVSRIDQVQVSLDNVDSAIESLKVKVSLLT